MNLWCLNRNSWRTPRVRCICSVSKLVGPRGGMVINPPHHVQLYKEPNSHSVAWQGELSLCVRFHIGCQELVNKMGGEFMSLGFIAFMVFCEGLSTNTGLQDVWCGWCYMVAWQAPINWGSSSFSLGSWLPVVPRLDVAILATKPEVMTAIVIAIFVLVIWTFVMLSHIFNIHTCVW